MIKSELISLVRYIQEQKCKDNHIEIRTAYTECPKLYDIFSSFSNLSYGGIIIFGINENDNYNICGVYDAADLQKKIMEQGVQMEPVIRPL